MAQFWILGGYWPLVPPWLCLYWSEGTFYTTVIDQPCYSYHQP